jgi:NAD(P)-dependent dehydrogenase (short-subunit alcohol dehydrogenase family)
VSAQRGAFAGTTAIITGGASGIGRALGAGLLAGGAHVVLADIDGGAAELAATGLAAAGIGSDAAGSIMGTHLDVRDSEATQALVDDVVSRNGRLDLMFNNAGLSMGGPTHEMPRAHWERMIDVNVLGVVNGVRAAYPVMMAQGHGHIVNTASGAGLAPPVLVVAYAMTKHAVVGLSTSLRPEAAGFGVRVSVLCPGAVDTAILDKGPPADLPPRASEPITGREYMALVGLTPMDVDRFAERALHGVARNKAIIVVPRSATALWYLQRLSPGVIDRIGRMTARRIARKSPTPLSVTSSDDTT